MTTGNPGGRNRTFYAYWSAEDGEWVGVCPTYPSLSHLDPSPAAALTGIRNVVDWLTVQVAKEAWRDG